MGTASWTRGDARYTCASKLMTTFTVSTRSSATPLPATLRLGPVELTVSNLDRSVEWYETHLGLLVQSRADGIAELGDGATTVVVLVEDPEARPPGRQAGLYHYALLYPSREELARATMRLDVENLLKTVAGEESASTVGEGLRMGHVHLHVGSIEDGLAFYSDVIGFDVWAQIPSAAFVSAGGYHHHLGFNTWRGDGVPRA